MKYFSLEDIKKRNAKYNIIFSERSNGKTYSVLLEGLKNYLKTGKQMAIVRRFREDFKGKRGRFLFDTLIDNGKHENMIKKLSEGKYTGCTYYAQCWYLTRYDDKLKKEVMIDDPIAFSFALTEEQHEKSASYPRITTVLFDEFLTRGIYLPDEFTNFESIISTIVRSRDDVIIYMLGNTVSKFSPYFTEMGLKHISKMNKGDIDIYNYGDSGLRVAVQYAETTQKFGGKKSDVYFAFDNEKLKMVTSGEWEFDFYPHNIIKYKKNDVKFSFIIIFDSYYYQGDVVCTSDNNFLFIHRKSTPIQDPDNDIIFTTEYNQRYNYFRNILKPTNNITKKIAQYFREDNVYYQDNEVGDAINHYLLICKQ